MLQQLEPQYPNTMNKKGGVELWLVRLLIVLLVLLFIMSFVVMFVKIKFLTKELESSLYTYKIYYSPHIINYYMPQIDKGFSGIIDLSKIDNEYLNLNLDYANRVAFKLTLKDFQGSVIKEGFNNESLFNQYVAQAKIGMTGAGGAGYYAKIFPITYFTNTTDTTTSNGFLIIEVVIPNIWKTPTEVKG